MEMMMMMEEEKSRSSERKVVMRGCIKASKGAWVVHRRTKKGMVTSLRFPTERERFNNKERERRRRDITRQIYAGLRAHGNYNLPKYADNNDLLRALCHQAGWHVDEEGRVSRKKVMAETGGLNSTISSQISGAGNGGHNEESSPKDVNLTLSLSLPSYA